MSNSHDAPSEDQERRTGLHLPGASALRQRDFRLYWIGFVGQVSGLQMLWVAQGWLIYELSGSAALIGVAGLARALPATGLSLLGGALADKLDQRKLLIWLQCLQVGLLSLLGTLTLSGSIEVWHLLVLFSASAASDALESPARQAIFPRLVPRAILMDAVAANSTVYPGTRFIAPLLGGVLMAQIRIASGEALLGAAVLFYLTALGYLTSVLFLNLIHLSAVEINPRARSVLNDMLEGVKFVVGNPIFGSLILMTYCTQYFGWSSQALFPIFAKDIFHGGEFELGLMGSMLGAGSLVGAATASNLASVRRRGLLITGGFMAPAVLLILFSLSPAFVISLALLLLIGWSQSVFAVSSQSMLQLLVPNAYRGRVMGFWGMTHTAVQPLGQLQLGLIAGIVSAPIAVASGGLFMLAYAAAFVVPNRRIRDLSTPEETRARDEAQLTGALQVVRDADPATTSTAEAR